MSRWTIGTLLILAAVRLVLDGVVFAGQSTAKDTRSPQFNASTYTPPRTPWGDPDLQGAWTTDDMLNVPLQRPSRFGGRLYLTDEEFAARVEADDRNRRALPTVDVGRRSFRQTSLISDPPDGRLPALTPKPSSDARQGTLARVVLVLSTG